MDNDAKIATLQRLTDANPGDHLTWFMLGRELLHGEQFDPAAAALARCCALKPDYTAAWRFQGDALRKAGRAEEALAIYRRGIEVSVETGDLQTGKEMRVFVAKLEQQT
jgi:tetratricopeptide (TPR) repeat protein